MDIESKLIRSGIVDAVFPERNAARVMFEDNDGNVSAELRILNRGGVKNKDYWMPDVNDEVVCLFAANDESFDTGWIVGACFNDKAKPQVSSQDKRRIDFSDGTFIEYDRNSHSLTIECVGNITIKGANVFIN